MRPIRYVSQRQESAVWLATTALWAMGALAAWLATLSGELPQNTPASGLTLLAGLVAVATVALRLPVLSCSASGETSASEYVAWLLGCSATINWAGYFALHSPRAADALPALLFLAIAEGWLHHRIYRCGRLRWLTDGLQTLWDRVSQLGTEQPAGEPALAQEQNAQPPLMLPAHTADPSIHEMSACDLDTNKLLRRQEDRMDDEGHRYLAGQVQITFSQDQQTQTLVVGFCPAFRGQPTVDYEIEPEVAEDVENMEFEDVAIKLVHCTPAGMRLALRRPQAGKESSFWLHWHAVQLELGSPDDAGASQLMPLLP